MVGGDAEVLPSHTTDNPVGGMVVVTVTVVSVEHDLTVTHLSLAVGLPENDTAVVGGGELIADGCMEAA